jgi:lipopolysaccharide/colanic/teichoic acid biosynthesis glycosyltransferase
MSISGSVRKPAGRARRPAGGAPGVARLRTGVPVLVDGIAVLAAFFVAGAGWASAPYPVLVLVVLHVAGGHRPRLSLRLADDLPVLVAAALIPLPLLAGAGGLPLAGLCAGALIAARAVAYPVMRVARRRGWAEPALIVGTGALGREVAALAARHGEYGLHPVGFLDHLPPGPESPLPLLGNPTELTHIVERYRVRHVIVCFPAFEDAELVTILRAARPLPAAVWVVPRLFELGAAVPARYRDEIWGIPLVALRRFDIGSLAGAVKRAFDVVAASLLLVLCAPLLGLLLLALLVRHGRPVLFRQRRVGRSGAIVPVVKLRTMTDAAPDTNWSGVTAGSALRRWLRASHLDELPQLIAVLRGDMSLVGPRPERPYFALRFAATIPRYADRLRARPGLTGWAQVHGLHGDSSIAERTRFDNAYLEHWSLWTDLTVLARTAVTPLTDLRRQHREQGGKR